MNTIEEIRSRLSALGLQHIEIKDESARHAHHTGGAPHGGHYRLHIISHAFAGHSTIDRHRMIYNTLEDMMYGTIHALSIRAQTAEEANIQPSRKG